MTRYSKQETPEGMEWMICTGCNGCGEGHYEGTRCNTCGGSGEVLEASPEAVDEEDEDEDEDEDDTPEDDFENDFENRNFPI